MQAFCSSRGASTTCSASPHGFQGLLRLPSGVLSSTLSRKEPLQLIVEAQHAKLCPESLLHCQNCLANLASVLPGGNVVSVGTGCSGSDVVILVLQTLSKQWKTHFGVDVQFHHSFSTESQPWKRQWIITHFQPEFVFADITAFAHSTSLHDVKSNQLQCVPPVDLWICGIECDSISRLSNFPLKGCVAAARGRTGETAAGCFAYIRRYRPALFIVENVKNLHAGSSSGKKTDLDEIIKLGNNLGYMVQVRSCVIALGLCQGR